MGKDSTVPVGKSAGRLDAELELDDMTLEESELEDTILTTDD
jgi:hypothetical protein